MRRLTGISILNSLSSGEMKEMAPLMGLPREASGEHRLAMMDAQGTAELRLCGLKNLLAGWSVF